MEGEKTGFGEGSAVTVNGGTGPSKAVSVVGTLLDFWNLKGGRVGECRHESRLVNCAPKLGRDGFHSVPNSLAEAWDAGERVLTRLVSGSGRLETILPLRES